MRQGRVLASLNYAQRMKCSAQGIQLVLLSIYGNMVYFTDFAKILYSHPSIKLAKLLIQPPPPHEPKLTLIMV